MVCDGENSGHSFIPERCQEIALANGVVSRRCNISRKSSTRLACRPAKRRTILGICCGCEPELAGMEVVAILPASKIELAAPPYTILSSGSVLLYVDDEFAISTPALGTLIGNSAEITIGADYDGTSPFHGHIDALVMSRDA